MTSCDCPGRKGRLKVLECDSRASPWRVEDRNLNVDSPTKVHVNGTCYFLLLFVSTFVDSLVFMTKGIKEY